MTFVHTFTQRAPWIVAAGLAGAVVFAVVGAIGFPMHIAEFMGMQIVRRGGYPESLQGMIGWSVHLGVSLAYAALFAALFAAVVSLPFWPAARLPRWGVGLGLAFVLGAVSTLLTGPAITATISLLAGDGFPASLPGLNTGWGLAFYNHVAFFMVAFGLIVALPDLLAARRVGGVGAGRPA